MVTEDIVSAKMMNIHLLKEVILENRKIFGFKQPNRNAVSSRLKMALKKSRLMTLLLYITSIFSLKPTELVLSKRVSILSSNSATQLAMLKSINAPKVMVVPGNVSKRQFDETHVIYNIMDLLVFSDFKTAFKELREHSSKLMDLDVTEKIFVFTCLVEKNCIERQRFSELYVSYNYGLGSCTCLVSGCKQVSGLHGFPVANYGWTPIWFDQYYVYGESTKTYLINKGIQSNIIEKFEINNNFLLPDCINSPYTSDVIGLVEGGAPGNLARLKKFAHFLGYEDKKIIIFSHPSNAKQSNAPSITTSFSNFKQENRFLVLAENSTGYLNAIRLGCPVLLIPTTLPRLDEVFKEFKKIVVSYDESFSLDEFHEYHQKCKPLDRFQEVINYHWG